MRLSLGVHLAIACLLVTGAAALLVVTTSQRRLVEEFLRFDGGRDTTYVAEAARVLEPWYAGVRVFTWPGADSVLARVKRPHGVELVVQSSTGMVVAATRADLIGAALEGPGPAGSTVQPSPGGGTVVPPGVRAPREGAVLLTTSGREGRHLRLLFDSPPRREMHAPDGRFAGTVYSLYMPGPAPGPPGDRVRGAASRAVLGPVLLAAALSVLLLFAVGARLLSPLAALTAATRRLAAGDRGARVPVGGTAELAELATAFNSMAESLERTEELRRQMVSDVAHELRTPLANLRCSLEAMQDGLAPPDPERLRALHGEVLLLGRLVDDLQTLSLADAGRLPLALASADARELAARAIAATAARAEAAGVSLVLDAPAAPAVRCDPARTGQMLHALLDNALAHTPAGGTVTVAVAAGAGDVTFEVRDTGPGLAPEHLPFVFERFWRADPARARGGGSGLGLSIVRRLAELQGGAATVASPPGEGARFAIRLPAGAFTASS